MNVESLKAVSALMDLACASLALARLSAQSAMSPSCTGFR